MLKGCSEVKNVQSKSSLLHLEQFIVFVAKTLFLGLSIKLV